MPFTSICRVWATWPFQEVRRIYDQTWCTQTFVAIILSTKHWYCYWPTLSTISKRAVVATCQNQNWPWHVCTIMMVLFYLVVYHTVFVVLAPRWQQPLSKWSRVVQNYQASCKLSESCLGRIWRPVAESWCILSSPEQFGRRKQNSVRGKNTWLSLAYTNIACATCSHFFAIFLDLLLQVCVLWSTWQCGACLQVQNPRRA